MKVFPCRLLLAGFALFILTIAATAQDIAPPIPHKLILHSDILNEDRTIWVRTPHGYESGKDPLPVLYLTDGDAHINEIGNSIDFLVDNGRMPPLIVVGIANTDRTRDLTPTHSAAKDDSGKENLPTSGGRMRIVRPHGRVRQAFQIGARKPDRIIRWRGQHQRVCGRCARRGRGLLSQGGCRSEQRNAEKYEAQFFNAHQASISTS